MPDIHTQQILFRLLFIHQETSGIFTSLKHILRDVESWDDRASRGFVKSELSDLIVQVELLCQQLNLDYADIRALGWERYNESRAMWEKRGMGDRWV